MKEYIHIQNNERRCIERLLNKGKSIRFISGKLKRSTSSVSDEIKKNSVNGRYNALKAIQKARQRRKKSKIQCMKVVMDKELKEFVVKNIKDDQSPKGISGRIKNIDKHIKYASPKAIYKFVESIHGRQIEKHLYSRAVKKKSGPKRGKNKVSLDGRTMIDKRPKKVDKRFEFGHFEGDFIESGKDGKGSLLVLIERKTRYPFIVYTESKKTEHINNLIFSTLKNVPLQSITLDNDISFKKHKELSELIGTIIFFCHPFCSHEKGTVENRNKAIRRYVLKRSDLSKYKLEYFKEVESKLRNKYMECLNYKTPQEVWDIEIEKWKKKQQKSIILKKKKHAKVGVLQVN